MHPKYVIRKRKKIKGTSKNDNKKRNVAENWEEEDEEEEEEEKEGLPLHRRIFI